ncbi:MAG: hypothetical protein EWV91_11195 [Microcystis aeruginosa Ma_QC_Ca_00000000_S207]|uniref:Uncharacterized protein n=1 Tax=Microcystis aeruginosa Ma_QC_Ca_00000000_S207 TaxID=2486251 RepID=A0A552FKR1_MICAE|nr:MAG: hypothetical protein EWV91_11195 [Microcystis aeruginosa Ma_QC_Ca_00000000_S207]
MGAGCGVWGVGCGVWWGFTDFEGVNYLGSAEKVFRWGLGVGGWGLGCGVWGVGFYRFSSGQLPNFQRKSPGIFPRSLPYLVLFEGKKV